MQFLEDRFWLKLSTWVWLAVTQLFLPSSSFADSIQANDWQRNIDHELTQLIETEDLLGVTWFAIDGDQTMVGGAGFADLETSRPMSSDTPVHIGSVAKTVLAIGVLRLIDTEIISLESKVADLLKDEYFDNPWKLESPVRVRHLLEHTAGLNNLFMWQFLSTKPTPDTPLRDGLLPNKDNRLKIRTKPGSQYSYSNIGYALLGLVIEEVSGQRYEDYLDQHVLQPLGMTQSTFHFIHQDHDAEVNLANGYFDKENKVLAQPMLLRPAGQFTTTASDMARFANFLLSDEQSLIPESLRTDLAEPSTTNAAKAGLKIGHGLAFALRDRHGVVGQCHPGTTFGFRANMCIFPDQDKAFFYAINMDSESADYEQFTVKFIQALNVQQATTLGTAPVLKAREKPALDGFYLLQPANMQEFAWLDLVFNFIHLSWQNDHLIVRSLQSQEKQLMPVGEFLYRAKDRRLPSHVILESRDSIQLSDGLNTYTRSSGLTLMLNWLSIILGILGLIYIIMAGSYRVLGRRNEENRFLRWPLASFLLFSLPLLAFQQQSFMQFGELTLASGLLTAVSVMLPVSLIIAIALTYKVESISKAQRRDRLAMLSLLQFCFLLVYWRMLPVMYWYGG